MYRICIVYESIDGSVIQTSFDKDTQKDISDFLTISLNQVSNLISEFKKATDPHSVAYHKIPKTFKSAEDNNTPLFYKLVVIGDVDKKQKRSRKSKYTPEELKQRALLNQHRYYYKDRPDHKCPRCSSAE